MKNFKMALQHYNVLKAVSISFMTFAMLMQLSSCDDKNCCGSEFSDLEVAKAKLIATQWKLQSVIVDDVERTTTYTGLTIQFTSTTFTTTNGKAVWPARGTWSFLSEDGSTIKRDDGIIVKVNVSDTTLHLTLPWILTTLSGGRLYSIKGIHEFSFVK